MKSCRWVLTGVVLVVALAVACPGRSAEVMRQDTSVWVRTPWKNLDTDQQRQVFIIAVRAVVEKIERLRQEGKLPKTLSLDSMELLIQSEKQIDEMASRLTRLKSLKEAAPALIPWLPIEDDFWQPSAFFILLGTKVNFGFRLLTVGGSGNLGFIVTPFRTVRVRELGDAEPIEAYYELGMAPLVWFHLDLGANLGGSVSSALTLGVVSGDVRSIESFRGTAVGAEATANLGALGVTINGGVLSNWYESGFFQYPYAAISLETGVVQNAVRLDLSQVLSDFEFFKVIGQDPDLKDFLTDTIRVPIAPKP